MVYTNMKDVMQYSTNGVNNDYVFVSAVIYKHAIGQHTHEWISQFTIKQILQSEYHLND